MTHSFTIRQLALTAALAGSMCVTVHAQALDSEQIFAELIDRNQTRAGGLLEYRRPRSTACRTRERAIGCWARSGILASGWQVIARNRRSYQKTG